MTFGDFMTVLQAGGEPVLVIALAICAFFLWKLYGVLMDIKTEIQSDRIETTKFRVEMMGRLGNVEKAVEDHGLRISILERK